MANPDPTHEPVMLAECLDYLALQPGATAVDATLGLGGHSVAFLEQVGPSGRLIGLDQDPEALSRAGARLRARCAELGWSECPITLVRTNFRRLGEALDGLGITQANGFLFDLGVSSMQLDLAERGFSFRSPGPLDMRMDPEGPTTAADLVNTLPEAELARILWAFGEERYSRRIARRIVEERGRAPFETTSRLADLVRGVYPPKERHGRIHPATRTFQALRIAVNEELEAIEPALMAAADRLAPGGRIVVLAYHSLEDRIVKRTFEYLSGRCRCAPELPACRCGAAERVRLLTRKPLEPSEAETARNPRARSARLRAVEALTPPHRDPDSGRTGSGGAAAGKNSHKRSPSGVPSMKRRQFQETCHAPAYVREPKLPQSGNSYPNICGIPAKSGQKRPSASFDLRKSAFALPRPAKSGQNRSRPLHPSSFRLHPTKHLPIPTSSPCPHFLAPGLASRETPPQSPPKPPVLRPNCRP